MPPTLPRRSESSTRVTDHQHTPEVKGPNLAVVGGSVIVAIMAVVVFIGAANAADCPRSKSAEATSVEAHHNADDKADVEA